MNIWLSDYSDYRLAYGQYLCRKWNRNQPYESQLLEFDIIFMLEETQLDGREKIPEKQTIWEHWCFEQPDRTEESSLGPANRSDNS